MIETMEKCLQILEGANLEIYTQPNYQSQVMAELRQFL
jgi:hypothetical protein